MSVWFCTNTMYHASQVPRCNQMHSWDKLQVANFASHTCHAYSHEDRQPEGINFKGHLDEMLVVHSYDTDIWMQLTSILHAFVKWNFPHNQLLFLLNKTYSNFAQQKYPVIPTHIANLWSKVFFLTTRGPTFQLHSLDLWGNQAGYGITLLERCKPVKK